MGRWRMGWGGGNPKINKVLLTSRRSSASSLPASEANNRSISSSETPAVSGTRVRAHQLAAKHANPKTVNVPLRREKNSSKNQKKKKKKKQKENTSQPHVGIDT